MRWIRSETDHPISRHSHKVLAGSSDENYRFLVLKNTYKATSAGNCPFIDFLCRVKMTRYLVCQPSSRQGPHCTHQNGAWSNWVVLMQQKPARCSMDATTASCGAGTNAPRLPDSMFFVQFQRTMANKKKSHSEQSRSNI